MVSFATVVLFAQIVELPFTNQSTLTNLTFNGNTEFSHVTVYDSDWDSYAWAYTVGYCDLAKFDGKAVPGIKYIALKPGTKTDYVIDYPITLTKRPRIAPELSRCGSIKTLL